MEEQSRLRLGGVAEPSDHEFRLFQELVFTASGIHLNPSKKPLLEGRLSRRIRELGLGSFEAYYRRVVDDPAELIRLLDRITTNETHFFREPQHFEYLDEQLLPAWKEACRRGARPARVRAWSAGCSTGEEPYSLAMVLLTHLSKEQGFTVEVFATDLSTRVLSAAQAATWPIEKAGEIPRRFLLRFMLRGMTRAAGLRAGPELREIVRFSRSNLKEPVTPASGAFDLIFCRNVLIYFDRAGRQKVIERLTAALAPGGRLFLGHSESIHGLSGQLRAVGASVYAKET